MTEDQDIRAELEEARVEEARLAKLDSFDILDTPQEHDFDTITRLAQTLLDCPVALISLVDAGRQWFKSRQGLGVSCTPRDQAFCAHAIHYDDIMVVEDAPSDPRFADNPLVTGPLGIRFYAGATLRPHHPDFADDLPAIGTLCIIDKEPRSFDAAQARVLRDLAELVSRLIEARHSARVAQELQAQTAAHALEVDRINRQLHQAERMAGIGSWWLDVASGRIEWSEQVYAIHGLPATSPPPLDDALRFFPMGERAKITRCLQGAVERGECFDFESDFISADGRIRRVRSMGEPETIDGRTVAVVGVFQDITEGHTREQELRYSATTDSLTGLPNRAAFEKRLETALQACKTQGAPLALLVIDLDGFKQVNDDFGHEAGDEVLRAMARAMRGRNFTQSFAARLGGDEFVMLITRPRDCVRLDEIIANLLSALRYTVDRDGEKRSVSATIGAARFESELTRVDVLLRHADLALYQAKRGCRGTGRIFGQGHVIGGEGTVPDETAPSPERRHG